MNTKNIFRSKQFNLPRFLIISLAVLSALNCGFAPKNTCEISETDAVLILENSKVIAADKSKLPIEEGKNLPNVRACSYTTGEHIDVPSLRWTNFEFKSEQEAQENFKRVKGMTFSGSSKLEIAGIGSEAYLTQGEDSGKKISFSVRKGKNVFMVIAHLENSSEKSVENVKTLAKKIADKTSE
jgi:hypothetical protein